MGSGWAWLVYNPSSRQLEYLQTMVHDTPSKDLVRVMCLDLWEHTWYYDYENVKGDYLSGVWSIINWRNLEDRFN